MQDKTEEMIEDMNPDERYPNTVIEKKSRVDSVVVRICIGISVVLMVLLIATLVDGITAEQRPDNAQAISADLNFTVKGTLSLDTEIDGETHRLICYHVMVTDFLLAEDEEQAALIGADEKFTKLLQPDGTMAYHSTYYSPLDDQRGLKVIKEFMDCGVENGQLIAGFETPLYLEFTPSTGYDSGIFDPDIKDNVEIIKFD